MYYSEKTGCCVARFADNAIIRDHFNQSGPRREKTFLLALLFFNKHFKRLKKMFVSVTTT